MNFDMTSVTKIAPETSSRFLICQNAQDNFLSELKYACLVCSNATNPRHNAN